MNYQNKYKNRNPSDTVAIIKDFFEKQNIQIEEDPFTQSISGTWSIFIKALFCEKPIYMGNGKGINQEYALASAYAELYERFCNKLFLYCNVPFSIIQSNDSKENNQYYFHPKEKTFSFDEGMLQSSTINSALINTKTKDIFSLTMHNQWIGVPFYNLSNFQDCKYIDPRVLVILEGSSGMAAGNTKQEAIIQGLSERFEHQVRWNFVDLIKNKTIKQLNLDTCIKNSDLQETINKIKTEADFYIFDASHYYNTPVLFGVIIDKLKDTITINFSSFPVFEIAVERICTELYQGVKSYSGKKNNVLYPAREKEDKIKDYFWNETGGTLFYMSSLPEEFFLKKHEILTTPSFLFLTENKEYSEQELYQYYLDIIINNKLNIYVFDCSLDERMSAIKLYMENELSRPKMYSEEPPKRVLQGLMNFYFFFNDFIFNNTLNVPAKRELVKIYNDFTPTELNYFDRHRGRLAFQIFSPWIGSDFFIMLKELDYDNPKKWFLNTRFVNENVDTLFGKDYRDYAIKLLYLTSPKYDLKETKKILSYFDIELTEEDCQFYMDSQYLQDKIIFDNIYKLYGSEEFKNYIKLLTATQYSFI